MIARQTAEWQADYDVWQKRDLSARRYVYVWASGIYSQARMEEAKMYAYARWSNLRVKCVLSWLNAAQHLDRSGRYRGRPPAAVN